MSNFVGMWKDVLWQWLSWVWPIPVARADTRSGPMTVRWELGRKVLNTAQANQSYGSLHHLWRLAFSRFPIGTDPGAILIMGLGGGSLIRILRHEMKVQAPITVIEHDPEVIRLARDHFGFSDHSAIRLIQGDAVIQSHALQERFGLVLVDLFHDLEMATGIDTMGFAHALRERCAEGGMVLFNAIAHDGPSEVRCDRIGRHLARVFPHVEEHHALDINRIFMAR